MIRRFTPALIIRVAALLLLSVGCSGGASLTDPVAEAKPPAPSAPVFPALSRPGHIYNDAIQLYRSSRTRYVLYEDGGFALQFSTDGEYLGRYTTVVSGADTTLALAFTAHAGWTATASLRGNVMVISYSVEAAMADFVGGQYVRAQAP